MAGIFSARTLLLLNPLPRQRVLNRYSVAVAAAIVAILLRWVLDPALGHVAFYVTLYVTVTFCAIVCGFIPAIVSGFLGFLGIFYWFVDPRHSLLLITKSDIHAIVACFFVSAVLITLGETNRRKQLRLNQTIDALTTEALERQRAEERLRHAHEELELRVEDRTVELSRALIRLESAISISEKKEEQLRSLSLRLMTLQDEERRRIARELHDTTGQTLAAIKMSVALIRQKHAANPDLIRLTDDLNALADEALQEVRTTSYLLHPPLLDEAGIASAARWFADGFARRSGIQLDCDIPEKMQRPPRDCELVLFRVLQECLTNVHRHSQATAASIRLRNDDDTFQLEIADNGNGIPEERLRRFNTSGNSAGVGITGMRERVHELGGSLEIRSFRGGTTISVALPASKIAPRVDFLVSR